MTSHPVLRSPIHNRWLAWRARMAWWWHTRSFAVLKRAVDLTLLLPAVILLMPLLLAVALAIKLQDGGPVLFWQRRVGRGAREFAFPKFRSMCVDAEARRAEIASANQHGATGVTFKMKRDPRITPIGRLIRRTSIDELPQLWCVLRGEMSLVGPRPALVTEVARYAFDDRERLDVTPGLTCFWQINGRSEVPFDQQVRMDVDYIRDRSIWLDIKLIAKTLPAVISGRGAY